MVKTFDIFIKTHYISSIVLVFIYVSFDFILEHFNFFFFNNKFFFFFSIYKLFYMYKNNIAYFIVIIILDLSLFTLLNLKIKRKDYILKNDEEI